MLNVEKMAKLILKSSCSHKGFRSGVSCAEAIPTAHCCASSGELKCKSRRF